MLLETPQLGIQRRLINPYASKTGQGDTKYSDLTEWTVVAQEDWRGGRGQDKFEDKASFFDSRLLETRIEGQVTLGPKPISPASDYPENDSSVEGNYLFGEPHDEVLADAGSAGSAILSSVKLGQQVGEAYHSAPAGQGSTYLKSVQLSLRKEAGFTDGDTITCSIYGVGSDDLPDSSLGSASLNGSDLSTSYDWETFTFASPIDLTSHDEWWIVLSTNSATERVYWQSSAWNDSYPQGYPAIEIAGSWSGRADTMFDLLFRAEWSEVKLAQSFTVGASDFDLDDIWLYCSLGCKHVKVAIYSDSGDAPDSELQSCVVGGFPIMLCDSGCTTTTIEIHWPTTRWLEAGMWVEINGEVRSISSVTDSDTFVLNTALSSAPDKFDVVDRASYPTWPGWTRAKLTSTQTLSATTKYWIVVEQTGHTERCGATPNGWTELYHGGTYANGSAQRKIGGNSWAAISGVDFLFRLNDFSLDGTVTGFARFDGEWYCATGPSVFKFDDGSESWSEADGDEEASIDSGDTVTGLEVWGGEIWAARGSDHVIRKSSDGSSWSDVSGENGTLLKAGGGYLHYSGTGSDDHKVYYTADGSTFTELGECGAGDHAVTAMSYYRDTLFAATAVDLWSLAIEGSAYPVLDWSTQEDSDNGKGMATWNKTNCLYIPLRYGLYRWNGDSMVAVGLEQDAGLPEHRAGNIVDICPTNNWLYVAVDAGSGEGNVSSVFCYNGMGGWHEMARADRNLRVKALGFSTINSPSRLWYGQGSETRYLPLPDRSDNPYQWRGDHEFNQSGDLITSWFGHDLVEVVKDLHEIVCRGESIDDDLTIDVWAQVDRNKDTDDEPLWFYWGQIDQSPRKGITWGSEDWHTPAWRKKLIGASSTTTTIQLDSDYSESGMEVGDFVRINGEVSQIQDVGTSGEFTLASALSEAPSSGDYAYAAAPAGREFRLKLVLAAADGSHTETPLLKNYLVRYQNNVLDRYLWTLKVNCQDDLKTLSGAPYGLSAADLRVELDSWATRKNPFTLVDQDGVEHTVKVTSAGEGGFTREENAAGAQYYDSTYNFNLVEVE
jgi:hypothetical protein